MNPNLKEQTSRGSFLFPIELYHTYDATGHYYVSCHWHPDVEILYLQRGHIRLFINGEPYLVGPDTIIFVNREELHNLNSLMLGTFYDALVFPLESLSFDFYDYCQQNYLLPLIQKKLLFPLFLNPEDPGYEEVRDCLVTIAAAFDHQEPGYQLTVKASLLQLLSAMVRHSHLLSPQKTDSPFRRKQLDTMKTIVSYLQAHMDRKIRLEDAAASCYMSPNYFCKYFKRQFGKSFTQYVNDLRLEKACHLLETTSLPIMEISLRCGFDNLSYFVRLFKGARGITPSDYRKTFLSFTPAAGESR